MNCWHRARVEAMMFLGNPWSLNAVSPWTERPHVVLNVSATTYISDELAEDQYSSQSLIYSLRSQTYYSMYSFGATYKYVRLHA